MQWLVESDADTAAPVRYNRPGRRPATTETSTPSGAGRGADQAMAMIGMVASLLLPLVSVTSELLR